MESEPSQNQLVERVLLQRHRAFLLESAALHGVFRFGYVAMWIAMFARQSAPAGVAHGFIALAAVVICGCWLASDRATARHVAAVEEALAQQDTREWEDLYIKTRYIVTKQSRAGSLISEPLILALLTVAGAASFML